MKATDSIEKMPKTIDVLRKITANAKKDDQGRFLVTEKQFAWLASVYSKEANGWNTLYTVTITTEEGQYTFSTSHYRYKVPHYIPNRASYGKTYHISFYPNK